MRVIFILLFIVAAYSQTSAEYLVFYENGKAGLRDDLGKVILPASFDALGWTDGSFSVINQVTGFRQKGKWGLVNLKKEYLTKAEYESVTSSGGDRIIASRFINPYTTKYGCLDLTGKITVPFLYDGIEIHGLRAVVFIKNGTRYEHGLIDLNDRIVLPMRYRDVRSIGTLRFAIQNFDKKSALFSEDGTQLTGFDIDSISTFKKGHAIIYQNFHQGLMDREGNVVVPPTYRELRITNTIIEGRASDTWNLVDTSSKEIRSVEADELIVDGDQYVIRKAGKFGTISEDLSTRIPVGFDQLNHFNNGLSVARKNNKFGVVHISSREVLPFEFDSLIMEGNFLRTLKKVQGVNHWTVYDTFNIKKTGRSYDELLPFNGKFFPVKAHGFWGAVDRYGKEVLSCVYDSIVAYSYDVANVQFKGLHGIISLDGRWKVYPQKNPVTLIDNERYLETQDSLTFFKTVSGQTIHVTGNPLAINDGYLVETSNDGSVRRISYEGIFTTLVSAPKVDNTEEVFEESEGLRGIKRNGQYGFVDSRGRLRIANRYEQIGKFNEGVAPVMILGKWGYVNQEDRVVINPNFETPADFRNKIAIVKRNGKSGVINHEGKVLLPLRYDSVTRSGNMLIIHESNRSGLSDNKGHVLIEPRFHHLELLPNNLVIVRDDQKWGVLSIDGMPVVPLVYSFIKYNPASNQFLANKKSEWKVVR